MIKRSFFQENFSSRNNDLKKYTITHFQHQAPLSLVKKRFWYCHSRLVIAIFCRWYLKLSSRDFRSAALLSSNSWYMIRLTFSKDSSNFNWRCCVARAIELRESIHRRPLSNVALDELWKILLFFYYINQKSHDGTQALLLIEWASCISCKSQKVCA